MRMEKKYDFILQLLDKSKLSTTQKERIVKLSTAELKKEKFVGKELEERVKRIEDELGVSFSSKNSKTIGASKKIKKPRPKETYELLSKFSSIEGGIKNLTHSFNYGHITYEALMAQCKAEYEEGKKEYPNVPDAILTRIYQFAFSPKPSWYVRKGDEKITYNIGWSEPNFKKWYKENNIHPAQDAKYSKEMIIPFKETIQIRADLGNLRNLINIASISAFGESPSIQVNIDKSIDTAQFYTDVDSLGQAIYHMFIAVKNIAMQNFCDELEIKYEIRDEMKVLKIIHIGSESKKNIDDQSFLGGDLNEAYKALYGLCNYDILSKFPSGYFRKIILSDQKDDSMYIKKTDKWIGKNYQIDEKEVRGFTHELKFY